MHLPQTSPSCEECLGIPSTAPEVPSVRDLNCSRCQSPAGLATRTEEFSHIQTHQLAYSKSIPQFIGNHGLQKIHESSVRIFEKKLIYDWDRVESQLYSDFY